MKRYYDDIEYEIQRTDDRLEIQKEVVAYLSRKHWLGYNEKTYYQQFVEQLLRPRVKKITRYIYQRKLCHISFLRKVTHNELKDLIRGKYDTICLY